MSDPPVVLSMEQALSMSYATLRMVHLGWRVIRVEPPPRAGRRSRGDPNRSIGRPIGGPDQHSYFVAPNVGKEALVLDLGSEAGRDLLRQLVTGLGVDVFCTNTLPARHATLGIDYARLSTIKPDLVWCSISAKGLSHPRVPGYDPVLQAECGYMDLTGPADGPPPQCGPPNIDLKARDQAFTQVALALWRRERTGRGACIDVSMARCAVSWLQTFLPMLDMDSPPDELRRSGNQHRQFIPVNAYPTSDGYVYMAVGSDAQWVRLVARPLFAALDHERFATNERRRSHKVELHAAIAQITALHSSAQVTAELAAATIPHAPITPVEGVMEVPEFARDLLHTTAPDGRRVRLPPAAVDTEHLTASGGELPFAPGYGEHTDALLAEAGLDAGAIAALRADGVVA